MRLQLTRLIPLSLLFLQPLALKAQEGEWRAYNNEGGNRFTPLSQIDRTNVNRVGIAWEWDSAPVLGEDTEYRNQSTPLMVGGTLYFTAGRQRSVIAVDAKTGAQKWVWKMDEGERNQIAPRANSGRGVSYWTDGRESRIIVVTPGYFMAALDPSTGRQIPSFGQNGVVDLKAISGVSADAVIGNSSPPAIFEDLAIVGPALAVGLAPPSRENVKGSALAIDVRTGALRWQFHTIPRPGEVGHETWEDNSWEYTGNAGIWAPITVDHERGIAYLPVEDATGDYYGGHRPGDNLFSASLVALNARTGERIWHFQTTHHDIFDWDNPTAPLLADDLNVGGRIVDAVVQLTKQGMAFVFDRITGEPVWPIVERPVPQSDVPGEQTAATQPFTTKPEPYEMAGLTMDDLIDYTPALRAEALELIKPFRLGGAFAPAVVRTEELRGTLTRPGTLGGTNWEGGAFDPTTGMLFVGSHGSPVVLSLVSDTARSDMNYIMAGGGVPRPQGLPIVKPPYSRITSIDLNTGDHAWWVAGGDTPEAIRNNPALAGVDLPRTGTPGARPVLLATPTLLFAGEGWGAAPVIRALDKRTGEEIWEFEVPGQIGSVPMSYEVDGRQYLAFWVGNPAAQLRSRLVTLALPE